MMQGCGVAVVYRGRRCIVTRLSPPSSHSPHHSQSQSVSGSGLRPSLLRGHTADTNTGTIRAGAWDCDR